VILRIAAALTLIAGLGTLLAYLHVMDRLPTAAPAARHLRAMKDRTDLPATADSVSYAAIEALPRHGTLAAYAPLEQRAVSLDGYVQRMLRAGDDDIHLEIEPLPRRPGDGNVRYVTGEITPLWRRGSATWTYERLAAVFRPTVGAVTSWDQGTRRVRITGWLLYDYQYEDVAGPGYGPPRVSSWELHPVTRIELWNDSLRAFAEYPR
jgi:hypothetical protein